jgi:hypothetical protein
MSSDIRARFAEVDADHLGFQKEFEKKGFGDISSLADMEADPEMMEWFGRFQKTAYKMFDLAHELDIPFEPAPAMASAADYSRVWNQVRDKVAKLRKGLVIQPNGDWEMRDIFGMEEIQAAVGSDDVDWSEPGAVTYYCFGHALYESPRNPIATAMYKVTHNTEDPLCGPVLVMGGPKDQSDTDVPDWFVTNFLKAKKTIPQDLIDKGAVPLSTDERHRFQMQTVAAMDQAKAALQEGRGVDFGGLRIGPEGSMQVPEGWASATLDPKVEAELDQLWNTRYGDCGQHRQRHL